MKGETGEQGPQGKDGLGIYPLSISLVENLLTLLRNNGLYFEDLETSFSTLNKILNDFVDKNISNSDYVIVLSTLQDFKQQYSINDSIIVEDYLYQVNVEALQNGTWTFSSYLLLKGEGGVMGETGKDGIGIFPLTREQKSYLNMRFADEGVYREIQVEDIDPFDENVLNYNLNTVLTHYIDYLMNTGSILGDLIHDILMGFKSLYQYINGSIIIGDYLYLVNIDALKNGGGWLLLSYDNLKGNTGANGADGKEGLGLFPLTYFQEEKMVELFNKHNVFSLALEDLGYPLNSSIKNDVVINNVLTNYLDGKLTKAQFAVDISLGEFKSLYPYINGSIIVGDYLYLVNIDALYGGGGWVLAGYEKLKGEQGPTGPSGSIGIQGEQGKNGIGIYPLKGEQLEALFQHFLDNNLITSTSYVKTLNILNSILIDYTNNVLSPENSNKVYTILQQFSSEYSIRDSIVVGDYLYLVNIDDLNNGVGWTFNRYIKLKGEGFFALTEEQNSQFLSYIIENLEISGLEDSLTFQSLIGPTDRDTVNNILIEYLNQENTDYFTNWDIIAIDNSLIKLLEQYSIDGPIYNSPYFFINDKDSKDYVIVEYENLQGPTGPIGKGIYVLDNNQKSELYDLIFNVYDYGLKDDTLIDALIKTVTCFNGEEVIGPGNVAAVLSALDDFISKNGINGSIIIDNYLFYIDSEGTPRDYTDLKGTGPIGSVMLWAGNDDVEIPEGWLECDGSSIPAKTETIFLENGAIPPGYKYDCYVISELTNEAILYSAIKSDYSNLLKVIGTKYGSGIIEEGYGEVKLPDITGISTSDGEAILKYIICYK
jgi:hypothetical protein